MVHLHDLLGPLQQSCEVCVFVSPLLQTRKLVIPEVKCPLVRDGQDSGFEKILDFSKGVGQGNYLGIPPSPPDNNK